MESDQQIKILFDLISELNKNILALESEVKIITQARKNFKLHEFDDTFTIISNQCENISNFFRSIAQDSLKVSKLKMDFRKLVERYQRTESNLLKTKKESLLGFSSVHSRLESNFSKSNTSNHTLKADEISASQMPYRESGDEGEGSKSGDIMQFQPIANDMKNNFNILETESDIKKLEAKLGEINEILNNDVLIKIKQEELPEEVYQISQTDLKEEMLYSTKNIWWVKIFKKRKYCLIFFIFVFLLIIILAIALPLSA